MKTMYRSSFWTTEIKQVEGIVDTGSIIYFENGRQQEPIQTSCYKWHESKYDALQNIKENLLMRVLEAEKNLNLAKQRLEDFINTHQ